MSDWQHLTPYGVPLDGAPASGAGGTLGGYRDILDARRSVATPRTPNAEYPDGYLGTINTRRSDRLLNAVQTRLTDRNYQRGVHKGDKIDASDYHWTPEFNDQSGLEAQARGRKWGPVGSTAAEQINHMGKNHLIAPEDLTKVAAGYGVKEITPVDPIRQQALQGLLPNWSV